jgi:nucleotide-binding universal stress UspA family protein
MMDWGKSIVVPLDGSELAEQAVPVASALARKAGVELRLTHVHVAVTADPIYVEGLPVIDEHMASRGREHEQAYLEEASRRLVAGVHAAVDLLDGRPAPALAAHARAVGAGLLVMTTHGRGGLERLWLGSVADELVRLSPVPLLLIRPEPGPLPGPFRRILVPLDGSPQAEAALEPASALAGLEPGAELVLLQVVLPAASAFWAPDAVLAAKLGSIDPTRQRETARRYLDAVARRLEAPGSNVRVRVDEADRVASAVLGAARDEQADVIVMATHGRSGLARLALGSVADKILRAGRTPLFVTASRSTSDALPA